MFTTCVTIEEQAVVEDPFNTSCQSPIITSNKYYEKDGKHYLYGGPDSSTHFDISNFTLKVCNLRHGVGREHFQALLSPKFDNMLQVKDDFSDNERVIVLRGNSTVKLYPLIILRTHELVNDEIEGHPVMVVYCFLAELAAVYERTYCGGRTFTFAVSGFTYSDFKIDNGAESFILWDRDTESLWWPINNRGVAGDFASGSLFKYNTNKWEEVRWGDIKNLYPTARVLRRGQTQDPPENFVSNGCN